MFYHKLTIIIFFAIICFTKIKASDIQINKYTGLSCYPIDYLHIEYLLKKEQITIETPKEWSRCHQCIVFDKFEKKRDKSFESSIPCPCNSSDFGKNGNFTIYISKDDFPVKSNNCISNWLKCHMPPTTTSNNKAKNIEAKRKLWDKIILLTEGKIDALPVYLELNPYAKIINKEPTKVILNYCNIYFRTASGGVYISNTLPLDHPRNIFLIEK